MAYEDLTFRVEDNIAIVTMSRPDALNALSQAMFDSLEASYKEINERDDIRVAVFTGAGRGFCSGVDIKLTPLSSGKRLRPNLGPTDYWTAKAQSVTKPTIAAVNGHAVGGGLALALAMDVRIASDQARLSTRFSQLGAPVLDGVGNLLPRVVGVPKALELLYTAEMLTGEKAAEIGLVNYVYPHEEFWEKTMDFARKLAQGPPLGLALTKWVVYNSYDKSFLEHLPNQLYASTINSRLAEHDLQEGGRAFAERRDPSFRGVIPPEEGA